MAQFSGKQFKGAKRIRKDMKRNEALVRNQKYQTAKAAALAELKTRLGPEVAAETLATLEKAGIVFKKPTEGLEEGFVS